jgi:F-type H+-transporting ATPase subunit epsilon
MVMADAFNFELVSPERLLLSEKVTAVTIPASEGEMTVMADHAPTMTTIKPGVVSVTSVEGKTERFVVFGGFADIIPSGCTLLAESALPLADASKDVVAVRVEAAKADVVAAASEETKLRLEQYYQHMLVLQAQLAA